MNAQQLEAADNANAEGAWLDLVAAFDRDREVCPVVAALEKLAAAPFVTLPSPAPKATVRQRVARFILRRF
jgi:hypothetical protein